MRVGSGEGVLRARIPSVRAKFNPDQTPVFSSNRTQEFYASVTQVEARGAR